MNIYEFAEAIGVSISTVSRAVNNSKDVSPKTRAMVLAKMKELGFVPSRTAASLASGRANTVAIWCPGLDSVFASEVLGHFEHVFEETQYDVFVVDIARKCEDFDRLANFARFPADGVIVIEGIEWIEAFQKTPAGAVMPPIVSAGISCATCVDHVFLDMSDAVTDAVQHLLDAGCERIAYLTPTGYYLGEVGPSDVRQRQYERAMAAAGKTPEYICCEDNYRSLAVRAVKEYVGAKGCPDGLFCFNDDLAIGAYRGLQDCGIRVPEDTLLVGCDGIKETLYMDHQMSTIVSPMRLLCDTAWSLLQRRLADPKLPRQSVTLKSELVIRETSRR